MSLLFGNERSSYLASIMVVGDNQEDRYVVNGVIVVDSLGNLSSDGVMDCNFHTLSVTTLMACPVYASVKGYFLNKNSLSLDFSTSSSWCGGEVVLHKVACNSGCQLFAGGVGKYTYFLRIAYDNDLMSEGISASYLSL